MEGKPNSTRGISFDAFVLAYCAETKPAFANVGSQATFLEARPNGTKITHLFRYEDQPRLIAFLENRLNLSLDLARENVSPQMPLSLSPETEATLRRVRSEEFALYDSIA